LTLYYKTKAEISREHKADGRTVDKWLARPDWPKAVKGKGWPVVGVNDAIIKAKTEAASHMTGTNSDAKRDKLLQEIERIKGAIRLQKKDESLKDLAIAQARGQMVSIEDHQRIVREVCGWLCDAMASWLSGVKVMTGDARLVAESERLRDNVFAMMVSRSMVEK